jgi:tetratricopeptide (TPR) repeat protein
MSNRLGVLCTQFLDYARAYDFYAEAARLTDQLGDRPRWSIAVHNAAEVLELRARLEGTALDGAERASLLNTAEALARDLHARGEPAALRQVDAPRLLAAVACERGEPDLALAWLTAAGEASGRPPRRGQSGAFLLGRGRCLVLLGRPTEALPDLTAAIAALDPDWDLADYVLALQLRGRARRATGDLEGALEDGERLAAHLWSRHRRYVSGFIDQVFSRAGAERERRQLQQHADQLSRTAEQDPLTLLDNRRAMERFLRERGGEEPVCLVMVDVDHFKEVNDQFGHAVGDEVLRRIASLLRNSVRGVDRVARWGGEEFLIATRPIGSGR